MYATPGGGHFISWDNISDPEKVSKVYYERFPDQNTVAFRIGLVILATVTAMNFFIGWRVKQREKKYYQETAVMRTNDWKELSNSVRR